MRYVLDTLEIERSRVSRALSQFEAEPDLDPRREGRELMLRHRKRVLQEAIDTLEDPAAVERELEPVLDDHFPIEVLRAERARLMEVNRGLAGTVEARGIRYPWGRIAVNQQSISEIDEWLPVLGERLDRRFRIGYP